MYFVSELLIHHVLTMHMIMYHICSCTCMPLLTDRQSHIQQTVPGRYHSKVKLLKIMMHGF